MSKFLPYSFRRRLPVTVPFVRLYLRVPWLWRFFGKQFLSLAEERDSNAETSDCSPHAEERARTGAPFNGHAPEARDASGDIASISRISARLLRPLLWSLMVLLFVVYLVPWNPPMPASGLDPSWQLVSAYAYDHALQYGAVYFA